MTTIVNSFEGGSNGVTITTGNSGGSSGNAFDLIAIGTGATDTYDNTHAHSGTLSSKVTTTGTSAAVYNLWSTSFGTQTTVWFREYLYFTANPAVDTGILAFKTSGGTQVASFYLPSSLPGKIRCQNGAFGTVFTTATTIPLNQWFRIEGFITGSATVGQVELRIFDNADSVIPNEIQTSTAIQNTSAPPGQYYFGCNNSVANMGPYWIDDIGLSTTGYLGPSNTAIVYPQKSPVQSPIPQIAPRGRSSGTTPQVFKYVSNAEGGTQGVTVTANNSATSGNTFTNISIGSGGTLTYDGTHAAHGSLAYEVTTTTANATWTGWNLPGSNPSDVWFRTYVYLTSYPASNFQLVFIGTQANVQCVAVLVTTNGKLLCNGVSSYFTTNNAIPLNQWVRIEGHLQGSTNTAAGAFQLSMYAPEGSLIETRSGTGNSGGLPAKVRFGVCSGVANIGPIWIDDIGFSTAGYLGPVANVGPVVYPLLGPVGPRFPQLTTRTGAGFTSGTIPKVIQLTNNAEGGTNGTTVTTGNSGGLSGANFDTVNIGGGSTIQYSSTETAHGALSYQFTSTSGGSASVTWSPRHFQGQYNALWFRIYVYIPLTGNGAGISLRIVEYQSGAGLNACSILISGSNGNIAINDATFGGGGSFVHKLPFDRWVRFEGYFTGHPTAGVGSVSMFYPKDSLTPVETKTVSNFNSRGAFTGIAFGQLTNSNCQFWMDDLGISTAGYLGPAGLPSGGIFLSQPYPVQAKIPQVMLFPRGGRILANPGGPLENANNGPVFVQADYPVQAKIPFPFLKGRMVSGSGGGPLVPVVIGSFEFGDPYVIWIPGGMETRWAAE